MAAPSDIMDAMSPAEGAPGEETERRIPIQVDLGPETAGAGIAAPPPSLGERSGSRTSGHYLVEHEIGRGGMGVVYKALDLDLRRHVAMKVMLQAFQGGEDAARFVEEAQATAQLQHQNIVPVYDFGLTAERKLFFTMKLVRGRTLAQIITSVRCGDLETCSEFSLFSLLEILVEVAQAVHYAHERGVVHRDLKPQNIMIGRYGDVQVMDWGLAKVYGRDRRAAGPSSPGGAHATGSAASTRGEPVPPPAAPDGEAVDTARLRGATLVGSLVGTPAYMSPEQARGDLGAIGPASDVYALGATLYHVLTGRTPAEGETTAVVIRNALHAQLVRPRDHDPSVPREVEAICMRAMALDPAARYPSARAFAEDIHAYLEGLPVSAHPDGPLVRAAKWARRHRAVTTTVAAALLLGLLGTSLALVRIHRAQAESTRSLALVFEEAGRRALLSRDLLAAEVLLAKTLTLADRRATREGLLEARVRGARLVYAGPRRSGSAAIAFSPDGRWLATAGEDHGIELLDTGTLSAGITLRGHEAPVHDLAFSPDGSALASASEDGSVRVFEVGRGGERFAARGHQGKVWCVDWSPDGRRLASGGEDQTVRLLDAAGGGELGVLHGHVASVYGVAFRPGGRELASASWDGTVRAWEVGGTTGTGAGSGSGTGSGSGATESPMAKTVTCRVLARDLGWNHRLAYSPDGSILAAGNDQTTVVCLDADTGAEVITLRGHERAVEHLAFSPDGRRIATSSSDRSVRIWDRLTGKETLAVRARAIETQGIGVAFHPTARRLALAGFDDGVRIFEVDESVESRTLRGHERAAAGVAWSPDGRRLCSSGWDRTLRIWDAATGREVGVLRGHEDQVEEIAWSRSGRLIASGGWDKTVRVWDAAGLRELAVGRGHESWIAAVDISPDERLVVSAGEDGTLRLWDAASGAEMHAFRAPEGGFIQVKFSPDGRRVAGGGSDHDVHVFDVATGAEVLRLRGHGEDVEGVAFRPDGKRIATGSWDGTVRIWDAATGAELRRFEGHESWVYAVMWSPDGRRVASAGADGTARVWDAEGEGPPLVCPGHEGEVQTVAFSPDGRRLASASYDTTVRIWDLDAIEHFLARPPEALVREAEERTGIRVETLSPVETGVRKE